MKKIQLLTSLLFALSSFTHAMGIDDDPILIKVMGEIETMKSVNGNFNTWNINAWAGKDLDKVWLKSEGEFINGKVLEGELQLLHSKAIDPFWDLQYGIKRDFELTPTRTWAVIAVKGLAPYLIDVDASLFITRSGHTAARLDAEYEYMLTQKLALSAETEINIFAKDYEPTGAGKGLSSIDAGLRLRYEISREFAPYIGINWGKAYGNTAGFASTDGEDIEDTQLLMGVHFWF